MLVTNCGVSRNVAEPGVSQMALMLSVEKKKTVLETEKKLKCEKSLKIQLIFFFNLPCAE